MATANRWWFAPLLLSALTAAAQASLVARYEFEGNADDSSGNLHNARLIGTASLIADARGGRVLKLDGGGYADCGTPAAFDIASRITVAAWVKIGTVRTSYATVISKGDSAWRLSLYQQQKRFHFGITGAPSWYGADGRTEVSEGQWHHVCGTYDGSRIRLYVDGALDATTTYGGRISTNTFKVLIGENAEATGRRWDGCIDEMQIFNHAMSGSEVAALAATQRTNAVWGRLANPGFEGHAIKATLFFPGQAKDGSRPYECAAPANTFLYTVGPSDERHLKWAESLANRTFVVDRMVAAGLNVVATSVWGESFLPCTTGWAPWAPMQCAPQAHDELFAATVGKHVLVVPFIESRADWSFRDEFPTFGGQAAPGTVSQIAHLIERYVQNHSHPEWANKWAQVYDQSGEARYAVALIHASSNRLSAYDHAGVRPDRRERRLLHRHAAAQHVRPRYVQALMAIDGYAFEEHRIDSGHHVLHS